MRVRFVGHDASVGRQIEGVTYSPGDEAEMSEYWATVLIHNGQAVAADPQPFGGAAEAEVEHRDTFRGKKKR